MTNYTTIDSKYFDQKYSQAYYGDYTIETRIDLNREDIYLNVKFKDLFKRIKKDDDLKYDWSHSTDDLYDNENTKEFRSILTSALSKKYPEYDVGHVVCCHLEYDNNDEFVFIFNGNCNMTDIKEVIHCSDILLKAFIVY